ncbi:hypothetical protein CCP3SC5AM1_590014 [Gammaproteobacteria bacterium]
MAASAAGSFDTVCLFDDILFSGYLHLLYHFLPVHASTPLRFQSEFNFRDAKQFWGLNNFMSVNQCPAINAANFAFFMVNVAHLLR